MRIIGIDPGIKGGIAALKNTGELIEVMPLESPFKISYQISYLTSAYVAGGISIFVEEPFIKPGTASKSTFTGLVNYGILLKSVSMYCEDYSTVKPNVWKSAFKLSKDKQLSMDLCLELYPESKEFIYGKNGGMKDGLAEAILIAYYGKLWNDRQLKFK